MNTDPESKMYQQLPMSSGLEERERRGEIKVLKNNTTNKVLDKKEGVDTLANSE